MSDPRWLAPWCDLDDAALLAQLRRPRGVRVPLVVDAHESSPERIAGVMRGEFEFNGERHARPAPIDWLANPSADVEWHILLHKFYYAPGLAQAWLATGDDRYVARWAELLDSWIGAVPPGFIAADVTGRRVQNWLYSLNALLGAERAAPLDAALVRRVLDSLHQQVEHLCAHLTPKRNHRTLELYAIFLAGVALPEMAQAAHWRRFALAQTLENLRADLLPDGVHCELSTDYHHLALRNWLQVRQLAAQHGVAVPPEMDRLLERALEFSLHVHRPDGIVPALSDGDARGYLPLLALGAELYGRQDMRWVASGGAQGEPPATTLRVFPDSGYSVLRSGWGHGAHDAAEAQYLVFDCGPLGEGNHGHLDALSFELAAHGRPLVVDPGRYTYSEAGPVNWRVHFRGTGAHNTVMVDARQQTRYEPRPIKPPSRHPPGATRHKLLGPAPATALLDTALSPALALLHGEALSHEYDARHARVIVLVDGRYWLVCDRLEADSPHQYTLNFQLTPAAQGATSASAGGVRSPGLALGVAARPGQRLRVAEGWVAPRYGEKLAAPRVCVDAEGRQAHLDTLLLPGADEVPEVGVCAVQSRDGRPAQALRLARLGVDDSVDHWFHAPGGEAGPWQIGDLTLEGRWLHLRQGADGRLRRAVSHPGAVLRRAGRALPLQVAAPVAGRVAPLVAPLAPTRPMSHVATAGAPA